MTQALVFANGDVLDGPMVRRALDQCFDPLVIAADGGARVAWHYGLPIDIVVGDFDSLSANDEARLQVEGVQLQRHDEEKDFTDLELALKLAYEREAGWIRIIGGIGDRLDQTIANVYLLGLPELHDCDVRMVAGRQEIRLLYPGEHIVNGTQGDTLSLIPVGGAVRGIRTDGLYYSLHGETLDFGPARGISNVLTASPARITTDSGMLLAVHTMGRA
ncbi:MAG: thiamine diphosphokinase [Chloroflexota bacterium]